MSSSSKHTAARAGATASALYASPIGDLELLAGDQGLRFVGFLSPWLADRTTPIAGVDEEGRGVSPFLPLRAAKVRLRKQKRPGDEGSAVSSPFIVQRLGERSRAAERVLEQAATQLDEYLAGTRHEFTLELDLAGTPFQLSVWNALLRIPYGATLSYRELATAADRPSAIRAAGAANGANPISIIVPCHRVVGSDASLTGYGGGIPLKRFLIEFERATLTAPAP